MRSNRKVLRNGNHEGRRPKVGDEADRKVEANAGEERN